MVMTLLVVITVSKMVAEYKREPFKISGYLASDVTCVFMAENYEDALLSFQRALALDRGNTEAMTKAAILLTQLGRHSEAENLLKRYAFSVYYLFYDLALFFSCSRFVRVCLSIHIVFVSSQAWLQKGDRCIKGGERKRDVYLKHRPHSLTKHEV